MRPKFFHRNWIARCLAAKPRPGRRLGVETLEDRAVPATINWNTAVSPSGGSWDSGANWVGGAVPGAGDDAVINLTSAGTVSLAAGGGADSVRSVTTNANTTLSTSNSALTIGVGTTTFGGPVTVATGGSLTAAAGSHVTVGDNVAVTVSGTMTVTSPASFAAAFATGNFHTDSITVNSGGTLAFTGATLTNTGAFTANGTSVIQVKAGGHLTAANSSFGWTVVAWDNGAILAGGEVTGNTFTGTVYAQPGFVPLLTNNTSFADVALNSGASFSGTITAPVLGSGSTAQRYVFPGLSGYNGTSTTFTVPTGATLAFQANTAIALADNAAVAVSGTMTVTNPASVTAQFLNGNFRTDSVTVNSGGTLALTGATLSNTGAFASTGTSVIQVKSGGKLTAANSTFGWTVVAWDNGAVLNAGDVTGNAFNTTVHVQPSFVPLLGSNTTFQDVNLNAGSSLGTTPIALPVLGSGSTAQRYVFSGLSGYNGTSTTFTVATGAALNFGANTAIALADNAAAAISGTVTITSPASVTAQFLNGNFRTDSVTVNAGGVLSVTSAVFGVTGPYVGTGTSVIQVKSGGKLTAANSTFGWTVVAWDNGAVLNAGDVTGNSFNTTVHVQPSFVPLLGNNTTFQDVNLNSGSSLGGTPIALPILGSASTVQRYVFSGLSGYNGTGTTFSVAAGATLNFGANTAIALADNAAVAVSGTMTVTNPASVTAQFLNGNFRTDSVTVNSGGTLALTGATLGVAGPYVGTGTSFIQVKSGGRLTATNSTFGWTVLAWDNGAVIGSGDVTGSAFNTTVYVPPAAVPLLANNTAFLDVYLNAGSSLGAAPIDLAVLGSASTLQRYVISPTSAYNGSTATFTIAAGAALNFGPNTTLALADNAAVSVAGTLTVTNPAAVVAQFAAGNFRTDSITVANGGAFAATNANFSTAGPYTGTGTSAVTVANGGTFNMTGGSFGWTKIDLSTAGAHAALHYMLLTGQLLINSQDTIDITNNDFSGLGANAVAASGPNGVDIPLAGNYWNTTLASEIGTHILDKVDNPALPRVVFDPVLAARPVTPAGAAAAVTYAGGSTAVPVSATFTSPSGVVNEGTATFTVLNGVTVIGTAVTVNVVNGAAASTYVLPAGTPGGTYTIQVTYNGTANFVTVTTTSTLTVNPATVTVAAANATVTYVAAGPAVSLSATVTSGAGTVDGGTVTFTVYSGVTVLGTMTSGAVVSGGAVAVLPLPAGTTAGSYTVVAVYNGSASFQTATDNSGHTVTVTAASSTAGVSGAAAGYAVGQHGVTLSATVTSPAGTVNEGTVTFTVFDGAVQVGTAVTSGTVAAGTATAVFTVPAGLGAGSYTIRAVYNGTGNITASAVATSTLVVSQVASVTAAASASAAYAVGTNSVTLTATVTSPAGTVGEGSVTFTILSGATVIGSAVTAGVGGGVATTTYALPAGTGAGTYTVQATYNGTTNITTSGDGTHTLTVTAAGVTVAVSTVSVGFIVAGAAPHLVATVTSTAGTVGEGSVTFTVLSGATVIGTPAVVPVSGGAAAVDYALPAGTAAGAYTVKAVFGGSANFTTQTVTPPALTVTPAATGTAGAAVSATYSAAAQTVTLTATVGSTAGAVDGGTVTFSLPIGAAVTSGPVSGGTATATFTVPAGTAAGAYPVTATYTGTGNFQTSADAGGHSLTVAAAAAAVTASVSPPFALAGQTITVGATVTSPAGAVNQGSVTFTVLDGAATVGTPVTVPVAGGAASAGYLIPAGTAPGGLTVQAVFGGTGNLTAASPGTQPFTLSAAASATAAVAGAATFSAAAQSVSLTAAVTSPSGTVSGGTATFTVRSGAAVVGSPVSAAVSGGTATVSYPLPAGTAPGAYTVEVAYSGTAAFAGSSDTTGALTVTAGTATAPGSTGAAFTLAAQTVTLSAAVTSPAGTVGGGTVTFTVLSGGTPVGTPVTAPVTGGQATAVYALPAGLAAGVYTVQAAYGGAGFFTGSAATSGTLTVSAAASAVAAAAASATAGQSVTLTAAVTSPAGAVNEGLVTFTVLSGGVAIGTPVAAAVTNGSAAAAYPIPAGTAAGTYVIQAVYGGTGNFTGTTDATRALTVTATTPAPTGHGSIAVGGTGGGAAQRYTADASGTFRPAGSPAAPFPGFGGFVRTATGDFNGDGVPDTVMITGPGTKTVMAVVSGKDGSILVPATDPFGDANFTFGGYVTAGDIDGDGRAEWVVTPELKGGPRVIIFRLLADGSFDLTRGSLVANFYGIGDPSFRDGDRAALGDVNGDGILDVFSIAAFNGGPRTALYDGKDVLVAGSQGRDPVKLVGDFFAAANGLDEGRGGRSIAAGDVNGDGIADLVVTGDNLLGTGNEVVVFSGADLAAGRVPGFGANPLADFTVGGQPGGVLVSVATADADGDGRAEVVVGSGAGQPGLVKVYYGKGVSGTAEPASAALDLGGPTTDGVYVG